MGFISLYIDGSSKRSYDDSLIGRSYMMIKFNTNVGNHNDQTPMCCIVSIKPNDENQEY